MLRLHSIQLFQFKNHRDASFPLTSKVVAIAGANGTGKTTLVDAIYLLCFTKSYVTATETLLPTQGAKGMRVHGSFVLNGDAVNTTAIIRETGRKEFLWNGEAYLRRAEHIGKLPAVFIGPDDVELITGSSEMRRKMIDALLCQMDVAYLNELSAYNKLLQQRNSLLKQWNPSQPPHSLLQVLNEQMLQPSLHIAEQRLQLMQQFIPDAIAHYHSIAGDEHDEVIMQWRSQLIHNGQRITEGDLLNLYQQNLHKDLALQRSTVGIHRDDLHVALGDVAFKSIASQGQRKSLLFALKLTEFECLQRNKGFAPIFLLDDVFEKLDEERMQNLLHEVCLQKSGQVVITDTHSNRLQSALEKLGADYSIIHMQG